jgi:WD40-like Beta Propeller Repeat
VSLRLAAAAMGLAFAVGCRGNLSPLSNRLRIGVESYAVFVGDGEGGVGDLFAAAAGGGPAFQVTFSRVDERAPALSPDGSMLAFLRARAPGDTSVAALVVMNLLNGAERRIPAGPDVGPEAVAWSPDGARLFLRGRDGLFQTPAPPATPALAPVPAEDRAEADTALAVILGDPPQGIAARCDTGPGLCARMADGTVVQLADSALGVAGWGPDSVAYLEGGVYVVRPLAGGRIRELHWTRAPAHPRGLTFFPGPSRGRDQEAGRGPS